MRSLLLSIALLSAPALSSAQEKGPYEVSWGLDGPAMGATLGVVAVGTALDDSLSIPTQAEIQNLQGWQINDFDYWATDFSSKSVSGISDVLVLTCLAAPGFMTLVDDRMRGDMWTIAAMYLETGLLATFLPSFGKGTVERYRPYAYNNSTPADVLYSNETKRSFFSGHSTWAFASMTFLASVYSDYYPESDYRSTVWAISMTTATTVGALRIFSGAHFPTDVLTGAAVGIGVGYLIPLIHKLPAVKVGFLPNVGGGVKLAVAGTL